MSETETPETAPAEAAETSDLVAAALARVAAGDAPALTLIHEGSGRSEPLEDPGEAKAWIRSELERGALDPEAPDRSVTWVPGSADVLERYVPLFVFLRELGYAQSFEFGPLAEGLEDWAELIAPLTDMGAQFSNDDQAAFLAPSSAAPEAATAEALEQQEAEAAVSDEEAEADTRRLIVILLGSLILIGGLAGGFTYLAAQHQKDKEQASETKGREAQRAFDEGVKARKRRDYAKAEQQLRRSLELQPKRHEATAELGALLSEDMDRPEEALKIYGAALERDPQGAITLRYYRGNVLLRQKRYAEAIEDYDAALEVLPIKTRLNKTAALIELGKTDEAKQTLQPLLVGGKDPQAFGQSLYPYRVPLTQLQIRLGLIKPRNHGKGR